MECTGAAARTVPTVTRLTAALSETIPIHWGDEVWHNPSADLRNIPPKIPGREKTKNRYVTPDIGSREIEPNIVYWDWAECEYPYIDGNEVEWRRKRFKQIKFLLLPNSLPASAYNRLLPALQSADWDDCQRKASGQKRGMKLRYGQFRPGTKLTVGFFPQKPGYVKGSGWTNMRSVPTMEQPELMSALRTTLQFMDDKINEEVPEYHDFALQMALRAWRPDGEKEDNYDRVLRLPENLKTTWSPSRDLREMSDEEINREYAKYRSTAIPDPVAVMQNLHLWLSNFSRTRSTTSSIRSLRPG